MWKYYSAYSFSTTISFPPVSDVRYSEYCGWHRPIAVPSWTLKHLTLLSLKAGAHSRKPLSSQPRQIVWSAVSSSVRRPQAKGPYSHILMTGEGSKGFFFPEFLEKRDFLGLLKTPEPFWGCEKKLGYSFWFCIFHQLKSTITQAHLLLMWYICSNICWYKNTEELFWEC